MNLVMQVRAGGPTAVAGHTDLLALPDTFTELHMHFGQVKLAGVIPVVMVDVDMQPGSDRTLVE